MAEGFERGGRPCEITSRRCHTRSQTRSASYRRCSWPISSRIAPGPRVVQRLAASLRPSACPFHRRRGTGPNLTRPARRGDAVPHPRGPDSCPNRRTDEKLPQHCVLHPKPLFFRRFFHHHNDFQPHCVSCRLPVQSRRRVPRRLTPQPPPQPVLPVVARIPAVPRPARTPVAVALTTRRGADALAGPRAGVETSAGRSDTDVCVSLATSSQP